VSDDWSNDRILAVLRGRERGKNKKKNVDPRREGKYIQCKEWGQYKEREGKNRTYDGQARDLTGKRKSQVQKRRVGPTTLPS